MRGSYSQKISLPALIPDMIYQKMEIGDGEMAMEGYFWMCAGGDPAKIERVRQAFIRILPDGHTRNGTVV